MTESDTDRTCGTCHACCTVLGIKELKKHTGQACKHLDGRDPARRCTIYDQRPKACSDYTCAWRQGLFDDDFSPQQVGFVATSYEQGWTLMVFDAKKAGGLAMGPVKAAVQRILAGPPTDVRIIYLETGIVVYMTQGRIHEGRLLRGTKHEYENLKFECREKPVGKYQMQRRE